MTRAVFVPMIALLAAGCATATSGANLEQVQPGMSREQVVSIMGQPQSSMHTADRECAVYSVMKDFWARVPWNMTARYQICYAADGRVESFGRIDTPQVGAL